MDVRQIPTPLLAGLVVAGLALGAMWWNSTAPAATSPAGAPRTLPVPRADPPLVVPGPMGGPDQVGPERTAAAGAAPGSGVASGNSAGPGSGAGPESFSVELDPGQLDWLLPAPEEGLVLRVAVALSPASTYALAGPATPGEYTLEVVCAGDGEIEVALDAAQGLAGHLSMRMPCDATVVADDVDLQPGYARIALAHRSGAVVIALFQLVRR